MAESWAGAEIADRDARLLESIALFAEQGTARLLRGAKMRVDGIEHEVGAR